MTEIGPYAASHPPNSSRCSESFFTDPLRLRAVYPAVYDQFARYYGQDPAARYPATRLLAGDPERRADRHGVRAVETQKAPEGCLFVTAMSPGA